MASFYIDSSAILKLIFLEKESEELFSFLEEESARLYSSEIAKVEVIRAVLRIEPKLLERAEQVLASIRIITISSTIITAAERLPHRINVRGMDAIHIASCNKLDRIGHTMITYDVQMAKAARDSGIDVVAPGVARI
jgi:predicted nucleic acid-binding protein